MIWKMKNIEVNQQKGVIHYVMEIKFQKVKSSMGYLKLEENHLL